MKCKAYGVPEPGLDDCPTKLQGSTLMVMKNAISVFNTNILPSWDPVRCVGGEQSEEMLAKDCASAEYEQNNSDADGLTYVRRKNAEK
jgi:hypothetical protein